MKIKARDLRPGMVYVGSSGDLRLYVLDSQPQTMTVQTLKVQVIASFGRARPMMGKIFAFEIYADNEYEVPETEQM